MKFLLPTATLVIGHADVKILKPDFSSKEKKGVLV